MRPSAKSTRLFRPLAALMLVGICTLTARADAPPGRYDMLTATTLRDTLTGLTWRRDFSPTTQNQSGSIAYCAGLGAGWRLPTKLELMSIVDEGRESPAIDLPAFPGTPSGFFWSSSACADDSETGWRVNFNNGIAVRSGSTFTSRARCVR